MSESSLVELLVARNGLESLGTYKMNYTRMVHSLTLKGVNIIILCICWVIIRLFLFLTWCRWIDEQRVLNEVKEKSQMETIELLEKDFNGFKSQVSRWRYVPLNKCINHDHFRRTKRMRQRLTLRRNCPNYSEESRRFSGEYLAQKVKKGRSHLNLLAD